MGFFVFMSLTVTVIFRHWNSVIEFAAAPLASRSTESVDMDILTDMEC
jgi:hypothetical protein